MGPVRPAAVAGLFYPDDPFLLAEEVDGLLAACGQLPRLAHPKALVVPHAGYTYSGAVAARAYEEILPARGHIRRVVLLGPAHRVPLRGLAVPEARGFATPLGTVLLDTQALLAARQLPQVATSDVAHAMEHSLEVQLPFLQRVLGAFELAPFAVGAASVHDVAAVLERLWGGPETLIVVSTDLSHYRAYDRARELDAATLARICARESDLEHDEACGATPLNGLLAVARRRGIAVRLLAACNSGDSGGGRERVVGYAALALDESPPPSAQEAGRTLVAVARGAIEERLFGAAQALPAAPWLQQHGATFVTLRTGAALRGCVGSLEAARALGLDVADNAVAAAFRDPRFAALRAGEWPQCRVEVSLLSAPRRLRFSGEGDLFAQICAGEDGLIVEAEGRRATFLPQVWRSLPDKRSFVGELLRKAGLPADAQLADCRLSRYRVISFDES